MTYADRQPDSNGEEPRVVVRDKRRIDPDTGAVRDAATGAGPFGDDRGTAASPFPNGGNPGDPAQASQPLSAQATLDSDEFAKLAADLAERTADLQRVTAEYANYRKRVDRDREVLTTNAKASVAGELLSVLDDLELARQHGDLKGAFKAVADRLVGALERIGLRGYGVEGEPFDPAHHEAVHFSTSPDVDAPTVTAVLRRGYFFSDRPLRAAVVSVTGPEHAEATSGDDVSTPNTPESNDADEQDRQDDARARSEQESKRSSAPNLTDETGPASGPDPVEDPA